MQTNVKVEMYCNNIKKCALHTLNFLVGKVDRRARKPWVTQKMISEMDARRTWKTVNNEQGRRNYRRLRNETKITTEKSKTEYLKCIRDKITELKRTGRCDLMYVKTNWELKRTCMKTRKTLLF